MSQSQENPENMPQQEEVAENPIPEDQVENVDAEPTTTDTENVADVPEDDMEDIDEEMTEATESERVNDEEEEGEEGKPAGSHVVFSAEPDQLEGGEEGEGEGEETPASEVPQSLVDDVSDNITFDELELLTEVKEKDATKHEVLEKKKQKVLGSVISIRRGDQTYLDRQKVPKFQNSYKLDSDKPFNPEKVTNILKDVLEEAMLDLEYDPDIVPKKAKWASSAIRARVKEQEYDRYKIICYVTIAEKLCQDIFTILRFLWDAERDAYAVYVHENLHLYAIGLCFGIYYE